MIPKTKEHSMRSRLPTKRRLFSPKTDSRLSRFLTATESGISMRPHGQMVSVSEKTVLSLRCRPTNSTLIRPGPALRLSADQTGTSSGITPLTMRSTRQLTPQQCFRLWYPGQNVVNMSLTSTSLIEKHRLCIQYVGIPIDDHDERRYCSR